VDAKGVKIPIKLGPNTGYQLAASFHEREPRGVGAKGVKIPLQLGP
jgi:hypothetical protein